MIDFAATKQWLLSFGATAPLVFVACYATANVFCFPTLPLSLLAGALFGPWWGLLLATLSANLGANGSFFLARYFGQARFVSWLHAKLPLLETPLEKNAFHWILGLRLIPVAPFFAVNYGSGLSPMAWSDFASGTVLGMLPWSFIYVSLGAVAGEAAMGASLRDSRIWTDPTLWILLAGVLLTAFLLRRYRKH